MKKLILCILVVFLLSVKIVFSQETPTLQKYVNDFAGVLSPSEESRINSLASEIEDKWTIEIAILTVQTIQPMTIEEYAVKTFEKNGIGKKDRDNGLLIVAAIQDRKWRFEVGYGLEPIITDATAGKIGRAYLTSYFREEKYGEGFYNAVDAIEKVIQNNGDTSFISEQTILTDFIFGLLIALVVIVFILSPILLIFSFVRLSTPKCNKCKVRMKTIPYSGDYVIFRCPKCGRKIRKKRKGRFRFFAGGYVGGFGGSGGGGGGGFGGGGSGGGGSSGGW